MGKTVNETAHLQIDSATLGMERVEVVEMLRQKLEELGLEVEIHVPEKEEQ